MNEDLKYLTLTLYGEARGEPIESIVAVGSVIKNRVISSLGAAEVKGFKQGTYKLVVLKPLQFSCWNTADVNRDLLENLLHDYESYFMRDKYLRQCEYVANGIIIGDLLSNVGNATHYIETGLYNKLPSIHWSKKLVVIATKGHHTFLV